MAVDKKACIVCESDDTQVPLIAVYYRGNQYWICARHVPVLIHKPTDLADKLPGTESLSPADDVS